VLGEDLAGEGFDFAEGGRLETAGALQPEAEAADAGKEI
jgi:hypothetical protein